MRFYDPTHGEISIDGFKLKDFNVNSIRSQVGIVQQEPVLFATTIAQNISYGNHDASQAEIEEAARKGKHNIFYMLRKYLITHLFIHNDMQQMHTILLLLSLKDMIQK